MTTQHTFTGFTPQAIDFLRDLVINNNKDWFEAHKDTYITTLQNPGVALVEAVGERLQAHFPEIHYDVRPNGRGSLMRMNRDVRFSADKSPYKTNLAMMFHNKAGKKMEMPGFGLQITPEQVEMITGVFQFTPDHLQAYRKVIDETKAGDELSKIVAEILAKGNYELGGETYKRVPKGYDADHPSAKWLKFTGLYATSAPLSLEAIYHANFVDVIMTHFINMSPIYTWLNRNLAF
jgi:uncharacterized protein (TIGR02453 family)